MTRSLLGLGLAALAGAAAVPGTAGAAATFNCDASALRGSVLGQAAVEPVVANRGRATCATASAGGSTGVLSGAAAVLPVGLGVAGAQTVLTGPAADVREQKVLAQGGVTDLSVKALPELPLVLPTAGLPESVDVALPAGLAPAVTGPLKTVLDGLPAGVRTQLTAVLDGVAGTTVSVGVRPALEALLPGGKLPNLEVLHVGTAMAYAGAACRDGRAVPFGAARVAGVTVLGQELPLDSVLQQTLSLVDSAKLDPAKLDLTKLVLPTAVTSALPAVPGALAQLQSVVGPLVLEQLSKLELGVPATLAQVKVTPARQALASGVLTQQGPRVEVSIAGQPVVDLLLGEARASVAGVDCSTPATSAASATPAQLQLQCTSRRVVLEDVVERGGKVVLNGFADPKYAGTDVDLRFLGTDETVARTAILPDGTFRATAPLPPKRLRETNRARYVAIMGRSKSLELKLRRRMVVSVLRAKDGEVTIAGRVLGPLARPARAITVQRRLTCSKYATVAKVRPSSDGTFSAVVTAPRGTAAAVYRLGTQVRNNVSSSKTFPTFTLPRSVKLSR